MLCRSASMSCDNEAKWSRQRFLWRVLVSMVRVCAAEARERELTEQFLAKCRSQDERERALQAARDQVCPLDRAHTHTRTYKPVKRMRLCSETIMEWVRGGFWLSDGWGRCPPTS